MDTNASHVTTEEMVRACTQDISSPEHRGAFRYILMSEMCTHNVTDVTLISEEMAQNIIDEWLKFLEEELSRTFSNSEIQDIRNTLLMIINV